MVTWLNVKNIHHSHCTVACSRLQDSGEKLFSKKKCEKRSGAGERPKSRAFYFRFARFNTSVLYYPRAWHRLIARRLVHAIKCSQCVRSFYFYVYQLFSWKDFQYWK